MEGDKVEAEKVESCKPQRPSCESCVFAAQFKHPGEQPASPPTIVTRRFLWFKWQSRVDWDIALIADVRLERWKAELEKHNNRVLCCRYPAQIEKRKNSLCGEYIREEEKHA